ncbi:hypothetical protein EJB05_22550, partial [Eragrostis curvula]
MSSWVRVVKVSHVLPAPATGSPEPALPNDHLVRLSSIDCFFVGVMPLQRFFFYEGPGVPLFPSLVRSLESSLATVLATFLPLAGKLTYRPSAGDLVVDFSPGRSLTGREAEYAGSMADVHRLAAGDENDPETLMRLGPMLNATHLPAPVLAVQVTRPAAGDGGVVVGVSVHHAVADGHSVWQFMRAWAAASSGDGMPSPSFDRAAIWHPKSMELARRFLHTMAPSLPMIGSVKQRILAQSKAIGEQLEKHPGTYVAVSSLVWASIVRAMPRPDHAADNDDEACYFGVPIDCRRHLSPPSYVGQGYFGNCLTLRLATAPASDLACADTGLARAAAAIRDAVLANLEDPLRDAEGWPELLRGVPMERLTPTGSSNRFMAYETDFGWGAPTRVELVSPCAWEKMLLLGAPDGGVQVTMALEHAHMERFPDNFLQV